MRPSTRPFGPAQDEARRRKKVSGTCGVTQKKAPLAAIARNLAEAPGLRPDDIVIVITENGREDWSFGNGVAQYVA